MFDIWKIKFPKVLNECELLFLANGTGTSTHLSKYSSNELNLVYNHEEAATKMFVYCKYILNSNPQITRDIISSSDKDVAISCYHTQLNWIGWMSSGLKQELENIKIYCNPWNSKITWTWYLLFTPNISCYSRVWPSQEFSWHW